MSEKIVKRSLSIYPSQIGFATLVGAGNLSGGLQICSTALRIILSDAAKNLQITQGDFHIIQKVFSNYEVKAQAFTDSNYDVCSHILMFLGVNRASEIVDKTLQDRAARLSYLKPAEELALLIMCQYLENTKGKVYGIDFKGCIERDGWQSTYMRLARASFDWDILEKDFT